MYGVGASETSGRAPFKIIVGLNTSNSTYVHHFCNRLEILNLIWLCKVRYCYSCDSLPLSMNVVNCSENIKKSPFYNGSLFWVSLHV